MRTTPILCFTLIASLTVCGCAGTRSDSWLDPMQAKSPIYTGVAASPSQSLQELRSARICCTSLDQIRFQPLDTEETRFYEINASSPAYAFATGKSFLSAFELQSDLDRASITIEAIAGATVFVPTVLILDENHNVSRAVESDRFEYTPAGFMEPQRLKGKFSIDRRHGSGLARERYLLVLTTSEDLRGSTQMISEASLYARSRGLADPGLPDPVAAHAATGVIRISTSDLEKSAKATRSYVAEQQGAQRYVEPVAPVPGPEKRAPAPALAPVAPAKKAPSSGQQSMLSDTRKIYDRMIQESVSSGDMDRAWRLVQEAERAGSTSARRTFVEAVERE
jgi:maltose operon protein